MQALLERVFDAIRYPTEDPQTTLVLVLTVAVVGMLVAVVFIALASPAERASALLDDAAPDEVLEPNTE
jgi:hypothetical protein